MSLGAPTLSHVRRPATGGTDTSDSAQTSDSRQTCPITVRLVLRGDDGLDVECIHTDICRETNNSYSLWLARNRIRDGFTVVNADTLFPHGPSRATVLVDDSALVVGVDKWLNGEEIKVEMEDGRVTAVGKTSPRG